MKTPERAVQIWPVLALAAKNRQVLTYEILSQLIGVAPQGIGQVLGPIQAYCELNRLPPLTALVVSKESGLPSSGFTAAEPHLVPGAQARVFEFSWLGHRCPTPEKFDEALRAVPSRAATP